MTVTDQYVFFWGSIYSQWYPCELKIDGRIYNCCEQYMMHRKALLFEDYESAQQIMQAQRPIDQKSLGRTVKGFVKEKWEAIARDVVFQANLAKFTQHHDLRKHMMEMGDRKFVEASPSDTIWGIGLHESDERIHDPKNWKGTNWLGEALDKVKVALKRMED